MDSALNSTLRHGIVQDHPEQVSWQSAFWALVTIQLSVMTQPSGRVLNFPIRLRTYIRSSPIICAFDCLLLLINFCNFLVAYSWNTRQATIVFVNYLFMDESERLGIQKMENLGLVRALLFLLGTLPQAVKLLCFGGIPWTKTWAALFLISYVTTEMLLFLRKTLGNTTQLDHFPPLRINRRNSVLVNLSGVRSIFTGLAVFLQMGLLVWACSEVFKPSRLQRLIQHDHALSALLFPLWVFMISSTISLIFFLTWLVFLTLCQRFFHDSPVTAMVAALIGSSMASGAFFWQILTATDVRTTLLGFLFPFILVLALLMAALGFMRFEVLRREIFLHSEEIRLGGQDPDDWSKWNSITAWGMFVVIILISILWYAFCYSPEGTHKPGWTNKLG